MTGVLTDEELRHDGRSKAGALRGEAVPGQTEACDVVVIGPDSSRSQPDLIRRRGGRDTETENQKAKDSSHDGTSRAGRRGA